jgi:hypothetical protein
MELFLLDNRFSSKSGREHFWNELLPTHWHIFNRESDWFKRSWITCWSSEIKHISGSIWFWIWVKFREVAKLSKSSSFWLKRKMNLANIIHVILSLEIDYSLCWSSWHCLYSDCSFFISSFLYFII